jgi:hypothetical protein
MTKMLSELLAANEPTFSLNLRQLEKASGGPNADIRLSAQILQSTQAKLRDLGLDPANTNAEELYAALKRRLLDDDERLQEHLNLLAGASSPEVLASVRRLVRSLGIPKGCFGLRASSAKKLLRANPPPKAMKHLGYRSVESMLKHEPAAGIYAAAFLYESPSWQRQFFSKYKDLKPSDFESGQIEFFYPTSERWEKIAQDFVSRWHHNSISFKELGVVVVLPITEKIPALAITSVLFLLESINDIRSASTYFKLLQVKPDFGNLVAEAAGGGSSIMAQLAGIALPWQTLQQYYDASSSYNAALFEPHVQPEELKLAHAEEALAKAVPALEFWIGTSGLALVENGETVSLNMLDVAVSAVNDLPFADRSVQHARTRVWHDLLARYLNESSLTNVVNQLSGETGGQPAELAEELA